MTGLPFDPDWVVPPGDTLHECLLEQPESVVTQAGRHGIGYDQLCRLLSGDEPITPELAERIEAMTRVPASVWLALEHNYRAGLAAGKTPEHGRKPVEGDRGFSCDDDRCPYAPHMAVDRDGAYVFHHGRWVLR